MGRDEACPRGKKNELTRNLVFYLQGVQTAAPPEYATFVLCREFGWTYEELMRQPRHFVDDMLSMIGIIERTKKKNHA